MPLPGVPPKLLQWLAAAAAEGPEGARLALVGGAVRDLLLHRRHNDPWRGVPDLDLVVEGGNPDGLPAAHRQLP
jgi:poly(A) polymerase